jgi:uncharacterized protein (TIGR02118 family)
MCPQRGNGQNVTATKMTLSISCATAMSSDEESAPDGAAWSWNPREERPGLAGHAAKVGARRHPAGPAFDMDYYLNRHTPMLREKFGAAFTSIAIEHGLAGAAPGTPPIYQVLCHLGFESPDTFQAAFPPHAAAIMADIANYTAAQPVIQIGEVKL